MSKFSNGPMTVFNGPCKRDPVTPVVIDPPTQQEIVQLVENLITQTVPVGLICNWQARDIDITIAATSRAIMPGWHLANGKPIEGLLDFDGHPLDTAEIDALKAIYPTKCHYARPEDDPPQEDLIDTWRLPKMDNGLVHTYIRYEE